MFLSPTLISFYSLRAILPTANARFNCLPGSARIRAFAWHYMLKKLSPGLLLFSCVSSILESLCIRIVNTSEMFSTLHSNKHLNIQSWKQKTVSTREHSMRQFAHWLSTTSWITSEMKSMVNLATIPSSTKGSIANAKMHLISTNAGAKNYQHMK